MRPPQAGRDGPLWRFARTMAIGAAVACALLSAACRLRAPTVPIDQNLVETRVAATLTALATATQAPATSTPPETLLPETPTPIETAPPAAPTATETPPPATPTHTALPPSPIPTETLPPPTPTNTRVAPTSTPTPAPTTTPLPVITDWRGEYYANRTLVGAPALVRNDVAVNFNWGQGSPAPRVPADGFSVRWTRSLNFDGATYRFIVYVDDGVCVWVDNQPVIDAWYDSSAHTVSGDYSMIRGSHTIRVEYYEQTAEALIQLWWEKVEFYPDWKGQYWSNRNLNGAPLLTRNDRDINYDWGPDAPAPGLPADDFSARWTRRADFDAGAYRFHAFVDDGMRLWVDGRLVLDEWYDSTPHEVTADRAMTWGTHTLRVEYYEHSGGAQISVWWNKVGSPSYPDWKGEYWSNRDLSGDPRLVRNDEDIDFAWGSGSPAPGLPSDNFSIRWSREVDFGTGLYRFRAQADDGLRFYLDGNLLIDEWHESRGSDIYTVDETLSGKHRLVVEHYEREGDASAKLWWTRVRNGPPHD